MLDPYRMVVINIVLSLTLIVGVTIYRYVYPKKKIRLFIALLLISILPLVSIFRKGTYESGDLTLHSVFLMSFYDNLREGNIFPQWAAGLCGGYGCPIFIFEYVLPFYIGSFFHMLGFSFLNSIKLLLVLSYILSGISMYLFIKDELKEGPAFAGSIFYLFAPYHLADMHYRVSVGEVLSFAFIPFIFLFSKKIIEKRTMIFFLLQGLSVALLILSHTSTALAVFPISLLYSFLVWKRKKRKKISDLIVFAGSFLFGLSLSTFYWLPAAQEVKYTWYPLNFSVSDFRPIWEFIYSPTRYGLLFQGNNGELRLIIGYTQILVVILSIVLLIKNKFTSKEKEKPLLILFVIIFFSLFFMMLSPSKLIWQNTPFLKTFILSWRMLVPITFITACIAGIVVKKINNRAFFVMICYTTILYTILNWGNRKMVPEDKNAFNTHWSLYTEYVDPQNFKYRKIAEQRVDDIPRLVLNRPEKPLEIIGGKANIVQLKRISTHHQYAVHAQSDTLFKENTFYFSGWKAQANYKDIPIFVNKPENGTTINFTLKKGLYKVDVLFADTKIRSLAKKTTYVAICLFFILLVVPLIPKKILKRRAT